MFTASCARAGYVCVTVVKDPPIRTYIETTVSNLSTDFLGPIFQRRATLYCFISSTRSYILNQMRMSVGQPGSGKFIHQPGVHYQLSFCLGMDFYSDR